MTGTTVSDHLPKIEDDLPNREQSFDWKQRRNSSPWQRATYSRDGARATPPTDHNATEDRSRTSSGSIGLARQMSSTRRDILLRRIESTEQSRNASPYDEDAIERDALPRTTNGGTPNGSDNAMVRRHVPLPLHVREKLGTYSAPVSSMNSTGSLPRLPLARRLSDTPRTAPGAFEIESARLPPIDQPHELHQEEQFWSSTNNGYPEGSRHSLNRLELSSSTTPEKKTTDSRSSSTLWENNEAAAREAANIILSNGDIPRSRTAASTAEVGSESSDRHSVSNGNATPKETNDAEAKDESTKSSSEANVRSRQGRNEDTSETSSNYDDKSTAASDEARSKRKWHPPWQLKKEILGHTNAVPTLCLEPTNRWFASGSTDKTIKVWDLEDATLRLNVKAHKAGVRATTFGTRGHRFLFSAGDDRQLLCTDIEVNRVVSRYPEQTSVIYDLGVYYPSELLLSCGRDKHIKLWDIRTQKNVKTLKGHYNTVSCLATIDSTRQIVSGSHDKTLRIWDLGEGRCTQVLTGHQKSLRSIAVHDSVLSSASTERIRHWQMPNGICIKETDAEDMSINCISVSPQGVLVAAGSNGVIHLWDWKTGFKFQKIHRTSVYESQEVPICVFCAKFDSLGNKLLISDASNVIKIYKEAYTKIRRHNVGRDDSSNTYQALFGKRASNQSLAQFSM